MFKNPILAFKKIEQGSNHFKIALLVLILWTIAVFVKSAHSTIYYFGFSRVIANLGEILKTILAPTIGILVYSIILKVFSKKKLTTIIETVIITQLPLVIASIMEVFTILNLEFQKIATPFTSFCGVTSVVLAYFGFKELLTEEKDEKFIKKFIGIQGVYYIIYFILTFLGIYI